MQTNATHSLIEAFIQISQTTEAKARWATAKKNLKTVYISSKNPFENNIKPKANQCYLNALAVCMENSDVEYVEGYMEVHGVPLEHAWNCYKGKHFDITQKFLEEQDRKILDCPHRAIMVVPARKALKYALSSGLSGPFLHLWLSEQHAKKNQPSKKAPC